MNDTTDNVIKTIKERNIRPKHSLFFALKHIGMWFLWTMTILVGALTFAAFLFKIVNSGIEHHYLADQSYLSFILSTFPFFWVVLIVLSVVVAHYQFRHTEHGHTVPLFRIALVHTVLTLGIGTALFFFGFGYLGGMAALQLRGKNVETSYLARWHEPEKGLLAGRVSIVDEDTISLIGIDKVAYIVDISGFGAIDIPTNIPVRIVGTIVEDGRFYACSLLPMRFRGAFRREELVFRRINEIIIDDERTTICGNVPTE